MEVCILAMMEDGEVEGCRQIQRFKYFWKLNIALAVCFLDQRQQQRHASPTHITYLQYAGLSARSHMRFSIWRQKEVMKMMSLTSLGMAEQPRDKGRGLPSDPVFSHHGKVRTPALGVPHLRKHRAQIEQSNSNFKSHGASTLQVIPTLDTRPEVQEPSLVVQIAYIPSCGG